MPRPLLVLWPCEFSNPLGTIISILSFKPSSRFGTFSSRGDFGIGALNSSLVSRVRMWASGMSGELSAELNTDSAGVNVPAFSEGTDPLDRSLDCHVGGQDRPPSARWLHFALPSPADLAGQFEYSEGSLRTSQSLLYLNCLSLCSLVHACSSARRPTLHVDSPCTHGTKVDIPGARCDLVLEMIATISLSSGCLEPACGANGPCAERW